MLSLIRCLFQVRLTNEDIVSILDTLVYDGSAEVEVSLSRGDRVSMEMEEKGGETQRFYRVSKAVFKDTGFNRIPCGICPVSFCFLFFVFFFFVVVFCFVLRGGEVSVLYRLSIHPNESTSEFSETLSLCPYTASRFGDAYWFAIKQC